MKNSANFDLIVRFAEAIGAQIAGTRGAVNDGFISPQRAIGLSGLRVRPQLYIACGVSGANFHTIGMEHSNYIIAVNVDRHARIFELANLCITEDAAMCIRRILYALERGGKSNCAECSSEYVSNLFRTYSCTS